MPAPEIQPRRSVLGLAGEAGEVVDLYKKREFHLVPMDREKLLNEFGDLLFYFSRLCDQEGFSLEDVMKANMKKLNARYPEGFVPGGGIR